MNRYFLDDNYVCNLFLMNKHLRHPMVSKYLIFWKQNYPGFQISFKILSCPRVVLRIVGRESTLANLGNDHGFIGKEYISIGMRPFREAKSKATRAYAQCGQ